MEKCRNFQQSHRLMKAGVCVWGGGYGPVKLIDDIANIKQNKITTFHATVKT